MAEDRMEYRERTIAWEPDGTVELYMAWKRDYDSCLGRLRSTGVQPVQVEELRPGYRIVLRQEDAIGFKMAIRPPRREVSEEERLRRGEHMRALRARQQDAA